jgi:biopolymer transport protein ExbD
MAASLDLSGKRGAITGINVTPFVDVCLVLLVIMMVSATYIVQQSLKVELPKTANSDGKLSALAAVTITRERSYLFNDEPIGEGDLSKRLRDAVAKGSEVNLMVTADKDVPHGAVVHVIDLAKSEGIIKFGINVDNSL